MFTAETANSEKDLWQILELQKVNLLSQISADEMKTQGFVTMHHTIDILKQMHGLAPSIIIKDHDRVVAYALTALIGARAVFPPLEPMFLNFEKLEWNGKPLNTYSFYVMGQVCVAKEYRGMGLTEVLYQKHKEVYGHKFDFIITEVSTRNHRSLRAHEKSGFKTIHIHRDELDEWAVVLWDWK